MLSEHFHQFAVSISRGWNYTSACDTPRRRVSPSGGHIYPRFRRVRSGLNGHKGPKVYRDRAYVVLRRPRVGREPDNADKDEDLCADILWLQQRRVAKRTVLVLCKCKTHCSYQLLASVWISSLNGRRRHYTMYKMRQPAARGPLPNGPCR
jgi:hypothetical protein